MAWDAARDSQARPGAGDSPPGPSRNKRDPLQLDNQLTDFNRGVYDDRGEASVNPQLNEWDYREQDQRGGGMTPPAPQTAPARDRFTYPLPGPQGRLADD
jgi:hypothetical protein